MVVSTILYVSHGRLDQVMEPFPVTVFSPPTGLLLESYRVNPAVSVASRPVLFKVMEPRSGVLTAPKLYRRLAPPAVPISYGPAGVTVRLYVYAFAGSGVSVKVYVPYARFDQVATGLAALTVYDWL